MESIPLPHAVISADFARLTAIKGMSKFPNSPIFTKFTIFQNFLVNRLTDEGASEKI